MTSGKYNHKKGWTHKLETKIKLDSYKEAK